MTLDPGSGLGDDARAIIDAARIEEDPSHEDVDRVRGRLFAHLGIAATGTAVATLAATGVAEGATVGSAAGTAGVAAVGAAGTAAVGSTSVGTGGASVAGSSVVGTSVVGSSVVGTSVTGTAGAAGLFAKVTMATKVGLVVLALGGAGTAVVVATRAEAPIAPPAPRTEVRPGDGAPTVERRSSPASSPDLATADAMPADAMPADAMPADAAVPEPRASASVAPRPAPAPPAGASASEPDPLAAEAQLLGRAQSALAAGRHDEALRLLDEHAARFPRGALGPEREAARWLALCGSGRGAAVRPAVAAFLAANPGSPLAARLRAACGLVP